MRAEKAHKLVQSLQRYADHTCRRRHSRGFYVKQTLIRRATHKEDLEASYVASPSNWREMKVRWIAIEDIRSGQGCMRLASLRYHVLRFAKMQARPNKRPLVVRLSSGHYYLWDGNHRTTSGILLGRTKIRCGVVARIKKPLTRKH